MFFAPPAIRSEPLFRSIAQDSSARYGSYGRDMAERRSPLGYVLLLVALRCRGDHEYSRVGKGHSLCQRNCR
jgi:hypothetical protein